MIVEALPEILESQATYGIAFGLGFAALGAFGIRANTANRDKILNGVEQAYLNTIRAVVHTEVHEDDYAVLAPFIPNLGRTFEEYGIVRSPTGKNVSASADARYGGVCTIFTRDISKHIRMMQRSRSIFQRWQSEIGEDSYAYIADIPEQLKTIFSFRAIEDNPKAERIKNFLSHEARLEEFDGVPETPKEKEIRQQLSPLRGGTEHAFVYGGSADATPRSIICAVEELEHNKVFGNEPVVNHFSKKAESFSDVLDIVADAMVQRHETSMLDASNGRGLPQILQTNANGLALKTMRDSATGAIFADGRRLNPERPAISLEACALTFQAHRALARYYVLQSSRHNGKAYMEKAELHATIASQQKERILDAFWMQHSNYFASYLNADENGVFKQLDAEDSTAGEVLSTGLLDPTIERDQIMIEAVAKKLFLKEGKEDGMLCDAGFRMRSLKHAHLVNHADYHGSLVVWDESTDEIGDAFLNGVDLPELSAEAFARVVGVHEVVADSLEYHLVSPRNELWIPRAVRKSGVRGQKPLMPLLAYLNPIIDSIAIDKLRDKGQNWSRGAFEDAFNGLISVYQKRRQQAPSSWQRHVQNPILRYLEEIHERYGNDPSLAVASLRKNARPCHVHILPKNAIFEPYEG